MSDSLEQLLASLDSLGGNLNEALTKAVRRTAEDAQKNAKLLAPVDDGRLRNSIIVKVTEDDGEIIGTVGSHVNYAPYVEFGTGPVGAASPRHEPMGESLSYRSDGWVYHNSDGFHYTEGQPARPYLYPALQQTRPKAEEIIGSEIRKAIKEMME